MRVARPIVLDPEQKQALEQWARARSLPMRLVERARIVLVAAAGRQDKEIAAELGITAQKASRWRKRFLKLGMTGLGKDAPRPGRTPSIAPGQGKEGHSHDHTGKARQRDPLVDPHNGRRRWHQ